MESSFEWDEEKNVSNQNKHGVSFEDAQHAFKDKSRILIEDKEHSKAEKRYFCIGRIERGVITVRFMYRNQKIRIIGAGYWRKERRLYEQDKK